VSYLQVAEYVSVGSFKRPISGIDQSKRLNPNIELLSVVAHGA